MNDNINNNTKIQQQQQTSLTIDNTNNNTDSSIENKLEQITLQNEYDKVIDNNIDIIGDYKNEKTTSFILTTYTLSWDTSPSTDIIVDCICSIILGAQLNPTAAKILGCADGCSSNNNNQNDNTNQQQNELGLNKNQQQLTNTTTTTTTTFSTSSNNMITNTNENNNNNILLYNHNDKTQRWKTEDLFSFYYELVSYYQPRVVHNNYHFFNALAQYFLLTSPIDFSEPYYHKNLIDTSTSIISGSVIKQPGSNQQQQRNSQVFNHNIHITPTTTTSSSPSTSPSPSSSSTTTTT
eukprot:UN03903